MTSFFIGKHIGKGHFAKVPLQVPSYANRFDSIKIPSELLRQFSSIHEVRVEQKFIRYNWFVSDCTPLLSKGVMHWGESIELSACMQYDVDKHCDNDYTVNIFEVYEKYRGQGIGTYILNTLAENAKKEGIHRINIKTNDKSGRKIILL